MKQINSFEQFQKEFSKFFFDKNNKYIFRGQSNKHSLIITETSKNEEWSFSSSFKMFIFDKMSVNDSDISNEYFIKILENMCKKNTDIHNKILTNISELQHKKIKTLFIDFTNNPYYALFFAISELIISDEVSDNDRYITIFYKKIENENEEVISIDNDDYNSLNKIKTIIKNKEKTKIIKCLSNDNKRALKQGSYFIIDNNDDFKLLKKYDIKKIEISYKIIEEIRSILDNKDVNLQTIYPDLEGLYDYSLNAALRKNNLKNKEEISNVFSVDNVKDIMKNIIKDLNDINLEKYKKFYVVLVGENPGIYLTWPECEKQVIHFPSAKFKSFKSISDAKNWIEKQNNY